MRVSSPIARGGTSSSKRVFNLGVESILMLLDDMIDELKFSLKGKKVINACVGVSYTSVLLSDNSMGISHTIVDGENSLSGEILGQDLEYLTENLKSNSLERGITVAILNAVSNMENYETGDPLDLLEGNKLCLFGFSPTIETTKFSSVIIYDFSNPSPQTMGKVIVKPFSSLVNEVCNTAVIFGSALVLGHTEKILKSVSADHLILSGISSVYAPSTLRSYGFEYVGKVVPLDKIRAFRIICEGGVGRQLSKYIGKIYKKL